MATVAKAKKLAYVQPTAHRSWLASLFPADRAAAVGAGPTRSRPLSGPPTAHHDNSARTYRRQPLRGPCERLPAFRLSSDVDGRLRRPGHTVAPGTTATWRYGG
jgi:hypothetical protein